MFVVFESYSQYNNSLWQNNGKLFDPAYNSSFNSGYSSTVTSDKAEMTFSNNSDYTMTLKIVYKSGGLYSTVVLRPHSSQVSTFSKSGTFSLKIKAQHGNDISYHKGDDFSVTCNSAERSIGSLSFYMSTYGSGLGPSISANEFEKNY